MSEIKKEVLERSEAYGKGLKLGAEGVIEAEEGLYASLLKTSPVDVVREKVDVELLEGLQEHNTIDLAAISHRVGTIGNHAFKKDDSLNKVTLSLNTTGKDAFNFTYDRSQQVNAGAPGDKDAGTRTKYGITRVSVDTHATGSRGQMAAVKTFLSDEAAKLLGDK
ncbi:MAG: hypothetical protein P4L77_11260 [Sulfuriferula sp.]|nr:hypothetical protein [Sulfuriferula sp.]